ncbi:hypothetical protein [Leifsonia sp. Leaf264]|uniref:hypothetical protein n=1 Tax=Leifsonia sp. Leaf264 TaxID=1736314 RepID=UPI0006F813A7|nr:hypothetical protein [Leifsonia sp. Leaf264]KQO98324.1 hypothetical protein ASF30_09700 [Leifsonia sp. Leaf264]
MSAFGIATGSPTSPGGPIEINASAKDKTINALGALVKWIPADVVAGYGIATTLKVANNKDADPDWVAWWIFLIIAPIFVAVVAWATKETKDLAWKVILVVPAFILWSSTIPASVWNTFSWFKDATALTYGVLFIIAVLFTIVAQRLAPPSDGA